MNDGRHPLDVDLADLVDGIVVDSARHAALETHLAGCLLCRIKRQRLSDAPPVALRLDLVLPSPAFPVPGGDDAAAAPSPGELWVAAGGPDGERMLVVVVRLHVDADRVLVAPVTFDVDAADDETLIVDGSRSPFGLPLAMYPSLATEVPRSVLDRRMGVVPGDGLLPGPAIVGPSDPRLEVRQYLADWLGSLEEQAPDPVAAVDAPPTSAAEVRSTLIAELRDLRGDTCVARGLFGWGDVVLAEEAGWAALATIDEVGVVLIVFDTPHGLVEDRDFHVARSVLTRFNATALVVLATAISDTADVFDSPSLNYGIEAPSGQVAPPRPHISGLAAFDAIWKFLDQTTGARAAAAAPSRGPVQRVDVAAVLRESAAAALADAMRQSSRFKIAPKRRGYESVGAAEEGFHDVLGGAFDAEEGAVAQALVDLAREQPGGAGA